MLAAMSADELLLGLALSIVMMAVVIGVHFGAMVGLRAIAARARSSAHWLVPGGIFAMFLVHVGEIALFALAYHSIARFLPDALRHEGGHSFPELFHVSATAYTTLGMSPVDPHGIMKIMAPMEALTGFMMITWSATFTYAATQFWEEEEEGEKTGGD